MAKNPKVPVAVANTMLDAAIGSLADGGKLRIYDGVQPTNGGDPLSGQHLLVECVMGSPAFAAAVGGILTANALAAGIAVYSGTPTWYRLWEADGTTPLLDGSAGVGDYDLNLSSGTITVGENVQVNSYIISQS